MPKNCQNLSVKCLGLLCHPKTRCHRPAAGGSRAGLYEPPHTSQHSNSPSPPQKQERSLIFNTKKRLFPTAPNRVAAPGTPQRAAPGPNPGVPGALRDRTGASRSLRGPPPGSSRILPGASRGLPGQGRAGRARAERGRRRRRSAGPGRPPAPVAPGDGWRGRKDGRSEGRTDGQTEGQTEGQTDGGSGAGAVPGAVEAQGSGWALPRVGPERSL